MKPDTQHGLAIEQRRDFLLGGNLPKAIWFLAWPVLIQMFLHLMVQTADMKMVGALGAKAVAAVGMATQLIMVMSICAMGVSTGVTAIVSRYYGKGDYRGAVLATAQALLLALIFAGAIMLLSFSLAGLMLDWMGAEAAVKPMALAYMQIISAGILFFIGRFLLWAVFQGVGDNRTPLYLDILANVINITGNYIFIFGWGPVPPFGASGAAMGTVLALTTSASLAFLLIRQRAFPEKPAWRELFRYNPEIMKGILHIGAPAALQQVIQAVANSLILGLVARTRSLLFRFGLLRRAAHFPVCLFPRGGRRPGCLNAGRRQPGKCKPAAGPQERLVLRRFRSLNYRISIAEHLYLCSFAHRLFCRRSPGYCHRCPPGPHPGRGGTPSCHGDDPLAGLLRSRRNQNTLYRILSIMDGPEGAAGLVFSFLPEDGSPRHLVRHRRLPGSRRCYPDYLLPEEKRI